MNEELAIVLGLVLAVIAIVLAYTFISQGTESTIGEMDLVEEHTDREISSPVHQNPQGVQEVAKWQREEYRSSQV